MLYYVLKLRLNNVGVLTGLCPSINQISDVVLQVSHDVNVACIYYVTRHMKKDTQGGIAD